MGFYVIYGLLGWIVEFGITNLMKKNERGVIVQ
jgi:hypothetical protein